MATGRAGRLSGVGKAGPARPKAIGPLQTSASQPVGRPVQAKAYAGKTVNYPSGTFTPKPTRRALPRPFQEPKSRPFEASSPSLDHVVRLPGARLDMVSASQSSTVAATLFHNTAMVVDGGVKELVAAIPNAVHERGLSVRRYRAIEIDARTLKPSDERHTQVLKTLVSSLRQQGAEVPEPKPHEGLYEYFHRKEDVRIWTQDNYPVRPVLVFRHFEELLKNPDDKRAAFDLMDLTQNKIPSRILEMSKQERATLELQETPRLNTVFSLEAELTTPAVEKIGRGLGTQMVHRFTP